MILSFLAKSYVTIFRSILNWLEWSGDAMVLGKLPLPGRPTVWITEGQGPTSLAVGAGRSCLDIFTLIYPFSPLTPSLWETARYRLKYCPKGPLNPNPTNQPTNFKWYKVPVLGTKIRSDVAEKSYFTPLIH